MGWVRPSGVLAAAVVWAACGAPPQGSHDEIPDAPATAASPRAGHDAAVEGSPLPLRVIMQGLSDDMAHVAGGLWKGDRTAVAEAARRVAEHPRVTPEEMGIIQSLLGAEFSVFVAHDGRVHDAAVALSQAATSEAPMGDLLEGFVEVQRGCVACHDTFQSRVSSALAAAGEERITP